MVTPPLPTPLPSNAHILSNGSVLLRTANGPVLMDPDTVAHIKERHMPEGTVAGSRFFGAEDDLFVLLTQVAERAPGAGAQHVVLDRPVGTDAVRPLSELRAAGLADAVVPVAGQATDATAANFQPRAGALELDRTRVRTDRQNQAVAQETQEAVVIFGTPPTRPDAFPGADAVMATWLMARVELGLSDEEMARGRSVITAFPGKLAPRLANDRFYQHPPATITPDALATMRTESEAFWASHVFVNHSPDMNVPGPEQGTGPVAGQVAAPDLATLKGDYLRFAAAASRTGARARLTHVLEARRGATEAARLLRARGVDVAALTADPVRSAAYRNRAIAAGRMAVDAPYWRQFLRRTREMPRPANLRFESVSQSRLLQICAAAEEGQGNLSEMASPTAAPAPKPAALRR